MYLKKTIGVKNYIRYKDRKLFFRRFKWRRKFKKKKHVLSFRLQPLKSLLVKNKSLKIDLFFFNEKNRIPLLRLNKTVRKRLGSINIKTFWGAFIKKGVRPLKSYFYVLKKFKSLLGLSVSIFIKLSLQLLRPTLYLKPRRFGAFIHLIPRLITKSQGFTLAKRFLVNAVNKRKEFYLGDRIINELFEVLAFKSSAFQSKRDAYSEAVENRVYLRRRRGKKSF